jgi:predicted DNA-binding transcriptional regulator YafY
MATMERVLHRSQQFRERRDGNLEMRLPTSGRKELTRWILSWMPHVKVVAPRELRQRLKQRMTQALANVGCLPGSGRNQHPEMWSEIRNEEEKPKSL